MCGVTSTRHGDKQLGGVRPAVKRQRRSVSDVRQREGRTEVCVQRWLHAHKGSINEPLDFKNTFHI